VQQVQNKVEDNISSELFNTILSRLDTLSNQVVSIKQENTSASQKLDTQVVEALTSLNNHSKQFDKITVAFEQKLIAYSLRIATKIIQQEVQQNSQQIALNYARDLISKLKDATKISVHINPKDYQYLQSNLDMSSTIELVKDTNVSPAGVVISSDIGNFDSTIESKLETLSSSIETLY
jgi:flagellar assembly protein FliH